MAVTRSVLIGCGGYLPERVMTNAELAEMVDTSDDWIVERSGIRQRRIAAPGELTSDLAVCASERALDQAQMDAEELDLIIVATATPDQTFPATAARRRRKAGSPNRVRPKPTGPVPRAG